MKRFLSHIGQTFLLLLGVVLVAFLPKGNAVVLNSVIFGLILAILVFAAVYLYRGHKKGLFVFIFSALVFAGISSAQAGVNWGGYVSRVNQGQANLSGCNNKKGRALYECLLDSSHYGNLDYCALEDQFDASDAFKNNDPPNKEVIVWTLKYLDTYDRAERAGITEKHGWFTEAVSFGGISGAEEDKRDCAEDFMDEVAKFKRKRSEMKMQTVYQLVDYEKEECWPCQIASLMLTITEEVCVALDGTLREAALALLGVMFLFWILYKVLALIGQFGTANNAEFFTDFLTRVILGIMAATILTWPQPVASTLFELVLDPVIDITTGFTKEMGAYNANNLMGTQLTHESALFGCECCSNPNSDCAGGSLVDGPLMTAQTKSNMVCMTCGIYKQTTPIIDAGRVMIYYSLHEKTWYGKAARWSANALTSGAADYIPWPFGVWVFGVVLVICFSWIAFSIAFRLLDIFLRFAFAVFIMPFLVTTFVFPISRQYTKKGWDMFAHAMVSMIGLIMGSVLILVLFKSGLPSTLVADMSTLMGPQSTTANNYAEKLAESFGYGENGTYFGIFFCIFVAFMGSKLLQAAQSAVEGLFDLASNLPAISGAAVMGMVKVAKSATQMGINVAGDAFGGSGKGGDKKDSGNGGGGESKKESKVGKFIDENMKKAEETAANASGKAVSGAGAAVGGAATKAGGGMMKGGAALCGTGIGAIVGVPLMIAGAAVATAGIATKYGAKAAGVVVKQAIKKGAAAVRKSARAMLNRIKQAPAKIKEKIKNKIKQKIQDIKNAPKKLKDSILRKLRGEQAASKYKRPESPRRRAARRVVNALDQASGAADHVIQAGDEAFGGAPSGNG